MNMKLMKSLTKVKTLLKFLAKTMMILKAVISLRILEKRQKLRIVYSKRMKN